MGGSQWILGLVWYVLLSMFGLYVGDDIACCSSIRLALGRKRGRYGSRYNTDSLIVGAILGEYDTKWKWG